ncbi:MAG: UbiA family prenyltransferase [Planctomycetes bacterium]|nr:UbiA family prenyltransferase [Planctomycetota bacterium]
MNAKIRAYLDLVRLPNLFTAAADVLAGYLYVGGDLAGWTTWSRLVGVSVGLYAFGVVLNDVLDIDRDARERPERPIPSGRVSRKSAIGVAMAAAVVAGGMAATLSVGTALISMGIIACVVLYDGPFKKSRLAPGLMGGCRGLNLALGMSVQASWGGMETAIPIGLMWLYITGVTAFARDEAGESSADRLRFCTLAIGAAVAGLASLPFVLERQGASYSAFWLYWPLWLGLLAIVVQRGMAAARNPDPETVQRAVRTFIFSLIAFDTCVAWASCGPFTAAIVAALIIPTVLIGRWFRST